MTAGYRLPATGHRLPATGYRHSVLVVLVIAGCGDVKGFSGPVPPLVTFAATASGALQRPPGDTGPVDLQIALVWGRQWLVEPLCLEAPGGPLPIDPRDDAASVTAVLTAGCRDPFGFVPARVAASEPAVLGDPDTIQLFELPDADLMVGQLTARVAYASFVVYDDKNGDGTLNLARPNRFNGRMGPGGGQTNLPTQVTDVVYGASFVAMTAPDQRVGYREGAFDANGAFYPRAGCGDTPPGFSVLAASGFTEQAAYSATINGTIPQESDPSQCVQAAPSTPVAFATQSPTTLVVSELKCTEQLTDASVRYREPDIDMPDFTNRVTACVHYPSFGMPSDIVEFVVSGVVNGPTPDSCVGLTHYILKGCTEGPQCGTPDWDHSQAPPSWWPC